MAVYDKEHDGYRVFIGDLGSSVAKYELEKDFERYGQLTDIWVARFVAHFGISICLSILC